MTDRRGFGADNTRPPMAMTDHSALGVADTARPRMGRRGLGVVDTARPRMGRHGDGADHADVRWR